MQFFKYALVFAVCFALLDFTEAIRFRRVFRKIGRGIKKVVKGVGKAVKKVGCKVLFGVACPAVVGAAGAAIGAGSGGLGGVAAGAAAAAGVNACHVRKEKCKRSVPSGEIMVPFSDEFSDYDENGDKQITFEEFQFAIMKTLIMADPDELLEPFLFADVNDDGVITPDEFQGAPFLFKHVYHPGIDARTPAPTSAQLAGNVTASATSPAA